MFLKVLIFFLPRTYELPTLLAINPKARQPIGRDSRYWGCVFQIQNQRRLSQNGLFKAADTSGFSFIMVDLRDFGAVKPESGVWQNQQCQVMSKI